jgi:hypothetical protein
MSCLYRDVSRSNVISLSDFGYSIGRCCDAGCTLGKS